MSVQVRGEQNGSDNCLEIEGRLDAASAPPVRDALKNLAERASEPKVRVDLSRVSFIDST